MESLLGDTLAPARFRSLLVATFAVIAALLALLGVYGVLAYGVAQRRREIGVRIALGADGASVVAMVLGRGLRLTGLGVVAGLVASVLLHDAVAGFLFGVDPLDPLTLVAVVVAFLIAAAAAAYLPARRAARVDPARSLREESA